MNYNYKLYGAIWGDLVGRPYEFPKIKKIIKDVNIYNKESQITDDSIMTLATADAIINNLNIEETYKKWGNKYDGDYYGQSFKNWLKSPVGTRNDSWDNGCLMRISPYMYIKNSLPQIIESVQCSHNHEESFAAVFKLWKLYREGIQDKIGNFVPFEKFCVDAKTTIDFCEMAANKKISTRQSIIEVVECGGDTDTNASIVGELCNFWIKDITKQNAEYIESKLDSYQLKTLLKFNKLIN